MKRYKVVCCYFDNDVLEDTLNYWYELDYAIEKVIFDGCSSWIIVLYRLGE